MRKLALLAMPALLLGGTMGAHALDKVTPDQIKTTFATGVPFTSTSPNGKVVMITFKADGTAHRLDKGSKSKGENGKWRASATGYCSTWGNSTERCYTVLKDGENYPVMNASNGVVARWKPAAAAATTPPATTGKK